MQFTRVSQACTTFPQSDGTMVYDITSTVLDQGELPHANIFLFTILDPVDPNRDSFTRLANPYDILHVAQTRDSAIAADETTYLASVMTRRYTDIEVAVQAKDAVRSRIDNCVNSWVTYDTQFQGTLEILHPTAEPTYEQQLSDAYAAARDERIAAEATVVLANAAVDLARVTATDSQEFADAYKSETEYCVSAHNATTGYLSMYLNGLGTISGVTGLLAASNTFLATSKVEFETLSGYPYTPSGVIVGLDPSFNAWLTAIRAHDAATSTFKQNSASYVTTFTSAQTAFCQNANTKYAEKVVESAQDKGALADAIKAKEEADATLVAKESAEAAALAAARAVCPDFDPNDA